jgi:hypothetical protein
MRTSDIAPLRAAALETPGAVLAVSAPHGARCQSPTVETKHLLRAAALRSWLEPIRKQVGQILFPKKERNICPRSYDRNPLHTYCKTFSYQSKSMS